MKKTQFPGCWSFQQAAKSVGWIGLVCYCLLTFYFKSIILRLNNSTFYACSIAYFVVMIINFVCLIVFAEMRWLKTLRAWIIINIILLVLFVSAHYYYLQYYTNSKEHMIDVSLSLIIGGSLSMIGMGIVYGYVSELGKADSLIENMT